MVLTVLLLENVFWIPQSQLLYVLHNPLKLSIVLKKLENYHDLLIPTLGIYPKEVQTEIQRDACTQMLIGSQEVKIQVSLNGWINT